MFPCVVNMFTWKTWYTFTWITVLLPVAHNLLNAFIIITGIQPLGRSGQRPELSQMTGMALVHCILGKFLGVACHCFPPLFRCSHFSPPGASTWEIPSGGSGNCGQGMLSDIFAEMTTSRHLGICYMPQIYDMGPTALLPLHRKACWGFFRTQKSDGFGRVWTRELGY